MNGTVRSPLRDARGVTLAELAVALGLLGVIMTGVVLAWSTAQQAFFVGSAAAEHQQSIRMALDLMVRELRATGRDATACAFDYTGPTSLDCTAAKVTRCRITRDLQALGYTDHGCRDIFAIPFGQATATSILVRSDKNDTGTIAGTANEDPADESAESVLYALAHGSPPCPPGVRACLTRDDGQGPVAMVAVDIAGLTFTYYPRPGFPPCDAVPLHRSCPPFSLPLGSQRQADNIGRIQITVQSEATIGGERLRRQLDTDVVLKNRS